MPNDNCETCGGEGTVFDDDLGPGGEHATVEYPCPDCRGDDFDDREPDDMPRENEDDCLKESPL